MEIESDAELARKLSEQWEREENDAARRKAQQAKLEADDAAFVKRLLQEESEREQQAAAREQQQLLQQHADQQQRSQSAPFASAGLPPRPVPRAQSLPVPVAKPRGAGAGAGSAEEKKVMIDFSQDDEDENEAELRARQILAEEESEERQQRALAAASGAGSGSVAPDAAEEEDDEALCRRLQAEEDAAMNAEHLRRKDSEIEDLKLAQMLMEEEQQELRRAQTLILQQQRQQQLEAQQALQRAQTMVLPQQQYVPAHGNLQHAHSYVHKPSGSGAASSQPPMDLTGDDSSSSPVKAPASAGSSAAGSPGSGGDDAESPAAKRRKIDLEAARRARQLEWEQRIRALQQQQQQQHQRREQAQIDLSYWQSQLKALGPPAFVKPHFLADIQRKLAEARAVLSEFSLPVTPVTSAAAAAAAAAAAMGLGAGAGAGAGGFGGMGGFGGGGGGGVPFQPFVDPDEEKNNKLVEEIHKSINSEIKEIPPPGDLAVNLMPHQKKGVSWMVAQEASRYRGGLLADEMGLGKTIQSIALMVQNRAPTPERKTTLVVCPLAVLWQWHDEIKKFTKPNTFKIHVYHGDKREKKAAALAKYDIVLTTYSLVGSEFPIPDDEEGKKKKKSSLKGRKDPGPLHQVKWFRVVLDESHMIKNRQSRMSKGAASLHGKYRWALSGTPVQNKIDDIYSLLRFLRIAPFDEYRFFSKMCRAINNDRLEDMVATEEGDDPGDLVGQGAQVNFAGEADAAPAAAAGSGSGGFGGGRAASGLAAEAAQLLGKSESKSKAAAAAASPAVSGAGSGSDDPLAAAARSRKHGRINRHLKRLQAVLKAIMLRRKKAAILKDLPNRIVNSLDTPFSPEEMDFYTALETQSRIQFAKFVRAGTVLNRMSNVLVMLLRLRQACDHPFLIPGTRDLAAAMDVSAADVAAAQAKVDAQNAAAASGAGAGAAGAGAQQLGPDGQPLRRSFHSFLAETVIKRLLEQDLKSVECSICMGIVEQAVSTPCGHVFCRECITNYLLRDADAGGAGACPNCRADVKVAQLVDAAEIQAEADAKAKREEKKAAKAAAKGEADDADDSDYDGSPKKKKPKRSSAAGKKKRRNSDGDGDGDLRDFVVSDDYVDSDDEDAAGGVIDLSAFDSDSDAPLAESPPKKQRKQPSAAAAAAAAAPAAGAVESKRSGSSLAAAASSSGKEAAPAAAAAAAAAAGAGGIGFGKGGTGSGFTSHSLGKGKQGWGDEKVVSSTKIQMMIDQLLETRSKNPKTKTIVFSQFVQFLNIIEDVLDEQTDFQYLRYDGSLSASAREQVLTQFREDSKCTVLLMSMKCGSLGLNLTCASRVVLMDPWWNPFVEEQAIDRCHRIGQKEDVVVTRMCVKGTVEERVLALQEKKRILAAAALSEGKWQSEKLSLADLKFLFKVD